jgi:predicted molibdopterin-dependent oxidoreductase YjgC
MVGKVGTLTNVEGRVQKVCAAVDPEGEAKPDWEIISLLAGILGKNLMNRRIRYPIGQSKH